LPACNVDFCNKGLFGSVYENMRLPAKLKKLGSRNAPKVVVLSDKLRTPTADPIERLAQDLAQEWNEESRSTPPHENI
jgi:hypothetical protein